MPKQLKALFESLGFFDVLTYINSGNVIFSTDRIDQSKIEASIEKGINAEFGLNIRVVLRTSDNIKMLASGLNENWQNNAD